MNPKTELAIRPEVQQLLDTAPTWPGWVMGALIMAWFMALIFIPFFLWGIYSQAYKQTRLLRGVIDELRRIK